VALPQGAAISPAVSTAVGLAFVSALLVAARDLVTRGMPPGIPSSTVTVANMAWVGLAGAAFVPWNGPWIAPGPGLLGMVLLGATFTATGNHLMVLAYRTGDPGLMSVLRYSTIPIAMVVGAIVFGDVPLPLQLLGAGMVILGGAMALDQRRGDV